MLNFFKNKSRTDKALLAKEKSSARPKMHELKVSDITRETDDAVSVAFEIPDELQEAYHFVPGQYLTLETEIDGEKVRRSYSLCSSPLDGELRVAIKKLDGGRFSTYANEKLTVGSTMRVMTPEGNFLAHPDPQQKKHYVAFAAGSGITPVYSILKSVLEVEPESTFTLFYGNRTSQSIIFKEKIDGLKNQFMDRLEVHHVLSREDQGSDLLKGRMDEEKCRKFSECFFEPEQVNAYYLCGPEAMINAVSNTLQTMGIAKDKIHYELFTSPAQQIAGKTEVKAADKKSEEELRSQVSVILDGEETNLELAADDVPILDAALDAGADVPYACKGAVCCTCRARVLEGSVEMEMNYALEDDEVEDGYVLTCQSHPTSGKVVISYDE